MTATKDGKDNPPLWHADQDQILTWAEGTVKMQALLLQATHIFLRELRISSMVLILLYYVIHLK